MDFLGKLKLDGKTALITGAGQGIGACCAEALATTGAHVVVTDINFDRAQSIKDKLTKNGLSAESKVLDVTDQNEIQELCNSMDKLDILVCNAGIVSSINAENMTLKDWQAVIDVNLTGVFNLCQIFGQKMIAAGHGTIVNIGSMSGQIVNVPQPQCHYNASKAAVHQLTRSLAVEWAKYGIRVNAVAPTYINTPLLEDVKDGEALKAQWKNMTPMNRLGEPHEVASAVQFLASDAASLITGSILNVDGGYTCI